jgi:hypothetical protein
MPTPLRTRLSVFVMAGLVPAIHDLLAPGKAWMAVTSTAMTGEL